MHYYWLKNVSQKKLNYMTKPLDCNGVVFILFSRWDSCQYSPPTLFWELLPSWGEQAFFLCRVAADAPLSQTTSAHRQYEHIISVLHGRNTGLFCFDA